MKQSKRSRHAPIHNAPQCLLDEVIRDRECSRVQDEDRRARLQNIIIVNAVETKKQWGNALRETVVHGERILSSSHERARASTYARNLLQSAKERG